MTEHNHSSIVKFSKAKSKLQQRTECSQPNFLLSLVHPSLLPLFDLLLKQGFLLVASTGECTRKPQMKYSTYVFIKLG